MFDGRAELVCLLFDVVPSFSEGLFRARAWDVVERVHLGLIVLLAGPKGPYAYTVHVLAYVHM
jgi:hypothetical protein